MRPLNRSAHGWASTGFILAYRAIRFAYELVIDNADTWGGACGACLVLLLIALAAWLIPGAAHWWQWLLAHFR
jgi:prolipoprotein diacylglyceryltransferase